MKKYKKYNRIAVIIRGEKRVWDYVKHNHFFYYERIAELIDFYFVTWETPTNNPEDIKKSFEGRNLVKLLELPQDKNIYGVYSAWYSPALMCQSIVPYLEEREQFVKYDAVFDQRTDTVIWIQRETFEVAPMTMYTPGPLFENSGDKAKKSGSWGITDYGYMSDSETYKLLSTRLNDTHENRGYQSPEWHLAVFCQDRNIAMPGGSVMNMIAVRPDICRDLEHPIKHIDDLISRFNRSHPLWQSLPLEEKIQICKDYNINIDEYTDKKFGFKNTV
jgi:hypothetical protein